MKSDPVGHHDLVAVAEWRCKQLIQFHVFSYLKGNAVHKMFYTLVIARPSCV